VHGDATLDEAYEMKRVNKLEARMNIPWQIAVASADLEDRRAMVNFLAKQGLDPIVASSVCECQASMAQEDVGLIFCARSLSDGDYRDLLIAARASKRRTRVVLTIRLTDWDEYLVAIRLGAFDVISAPCRPTDMEWMIIQALRDEHARSRQISFAQQAASALQQSQVSKSA
jgi:DNA-binding NtrC family response regulator